MKSIAGPTAPIRTRKTLAGDGLSRILHLRMASPTIDETSCDEEKELTSNGNTGGSQ